MSDAHLKARDYCLLEPLSAHTILQLSTDPVRIPSKYYLCLSRYSLESGSGGTFAETTREFPRRNDR